MLLFLSTSKCGFLVCIFSLFSIMAGICLIFLGKTFLENPIIENDGIMQLYLIDYRVGFVSRALIGEIISWFTDTVTPTMVSIISTVAVAISLFLQAVFSSMVLRKALREKQMIMILFVAFLTLSPVAVVWNIKCLGLLDVYTLIAYYFYLFGTKTKAVAWITPFLIFLGLTIHYYFALTFLPGIIAMQFYFLCRENKRKGLSLFLFVVSCVVGLLATCYFVFCAKNVAKLSSDELFELMKTKWDGNFLRIYFVFINSNSSSEESFATFFAQKTK